MNQNWDKDVIMSKARNVMSITWLEQNAKIQFIWSVELCEHAKMILSLF